MSEKRIYTAQEMRNVARGLLDVKDADEIRAALLAYAAMVERCERRLTQLRDYRDEDLINEINYILKGATNG